MKRGFTLIELIAVIATLGIIAIIVVPNVMQTINNSKESLCQTQEDMIIKAAKNWGLENESIVVTGNVSAPSITTVKISDLQSAGYLDAKQVKNILNNSNMYVNCKINVTWESNQFVYRIDEKCSCNPLTYVYAWNTINLYYSGANQSSSSAISPSYNSFAAMNTVQHIGKIRNYGLKYGIENGKITEAYVCFIYDSEEICLQGSTDGSTWESNKQILNEKLSCNCTSSSYCSCSGGGLTAVALPSGYVSVEDDDWLCDVNNGGDAACYSW